MNINVGIDLTLGLGSHQQRVEVLYRTSTPLLAYLKPWGGDFVLVIRDGHILGIARRDKRPIWLKLRDRIDLYRRTHSTQINDGSMGNDPSLADCCT